MTLEEIREKVENYFNVDVTDHSRIEEYVNARCVFVLIGLEYGHSSNQMANFLGFNRTLIAYYKRTYSYNPMFVKMKKLCLGSLDITSLTVQAGLVARINAVKDVLMQLDIEDMPEVVSRLELMAKAKQWKNKDETRHYTSNGIPFLE